MSEGSCSSKRKCLCGEIANNFTSTTPLNPGRRFYKCPKPEGSSCGYWEWVEDPVPDRALVVINNLKCELDVANLKINNLKSLLDDGKTEKDKLKEKVVAMKARNNLLVTKQLELEDRILKMKIFIMISCALFVGFIAAIIKS
uniref:Uncharacterized protein At4g04775-like n=2 Tax=Nicotiana TaxID=4085 RepID=A0A1S3ZLL5_TOBAC|nr:PREDICTED: uncharacterized protein At4g04775-like [Nicotiana sylvestris]XP_016465194.1 PREDICTED: uncharacterized protein At4g04775-like [Nicotiana tabacum]